VTIQGARPPARPATAGELADETPVAYSTTDAAGRFVLLGVPPGAIRMSTYDAGGDPGAPVDPKLKKKFITTTWISAILWVVVWAIIHFGLLKLPNLPSGY